MSAQSDTEDEGSALRREEQQRDAHSRGRPRIRNGAANESQACDSDYRPNDDIAQTERPSTVSRRPAGEAEENQVSMSQPGGR